MGRIQSNTGLVTGLNITNTVDQLMQVASRKRSLLESRTKELQSERAAIEQLSSLVLGFQFAANKLKTSTLFNATAAKASADTITAKPSSSNPPAAGKYQFTPLQAATAQQIVSGSISDLSAIESGELSLGFGGRVDQTVALADINGGAGFKAGKIRITDRSGQTSEIDLRAARTAGDVIDTINDSFAISVKATIVGNTIRLDDSSGGSGNLRVQEVSGGTTAASLGLSGINTTSDSAIGTDLVRLTENSRLGLLNDGRGVRLRDSVADLEITVADGSLVNVDLGDADTVGEVLDAINAAEPTKFQASVAADGNRIQLTDLTSGSNAFAVTSIGSGSAAEDLGLTTTAAGNVITGSRLLSGLGDTLVSSLGGGQGFELGQITITDRSGASASVNLASASTLGGVVDAINAAAVGVEASVNSAGNGLLITNTSGGSGNLVIANGDATNSADALGIATNAAVASVNSGSLHKQSVAETTLLRTLNGGKGVSFGSFAITDSSGLRQSINLSDLDVDSASVRDVLDKINALSVGVEARINETGDGILLIDTAGGAGDLTVAENFGGSTAKNLNLLGASTTVDIEGTPTKVIDGGFTLSIDLSDLESSAESVTLASLNGGDGVDLGIFQVIAANDTEAEPRRFAVNLGEAGNEALTVGDVLDKINAAANSAGVAVVAQLNTARTGIELVDSSFGGGTLQVVDLGSGTAGADLKLTNVAKTSGTTQTINAAGLFASTNGNQSAIESLASRINDAGRGYTASAFFDGAGYRLSINVTKPGTANRLTIDAAGTDVSFEEAVAARDAVLQLGSGAVGGVVIASPDNSFENVISGLDVDVEEADGETVTVDITSTDTGFVSAVEDFVDSYNSLRTALDSLTSFDAEELTTGLLFGRSEALRVESDLARLVSGSFRTGTDIGSLGEIGISLDKEGKLEINGSRLTSAYRNDAAAVKEFFNAKSTGVIAKLTSTVEQLAGEESSLLAARFDTLTATIDTNTERMDRYKVSLDAQRERLLLQFFRLEETISKLQGSLSALNSLQPISPLT